MILISHIPTHFVTDIALWEKSTHFVITVAFYIKRPDEFRNKLLSHFVIK